MKVSGVRLAHRFPEAKPPGVRGFPPAGDIVCHNTPLYKARADGAFFVCLASQTG